MEKLIQRDAAKFSSRIRELGQAMTEMQAGKCIACVNHHVPVTALASCHLNLLFATGSSDGNVRICSIESGVCIQKLGQKAKHGHQSPVSGCAWKSDGSYLVSSGMDSTIRLWRPQHRLQWSFGSQLLAVVSTVAPVSFIHLVESFDMIVSGLVDRGKPAYHRLKSSEILLGITDVWRVDGEKLSRLGGLEGAFSHSRKVTAACFLRQAGMLATVSDDSSIRFWKLLMSRTRATMHAQHLHTHFIHSNSVRSCVSLFDGRFMISADDDGNVITQDVASEQKHWQLALYGRTAVAESVREDAEMLFRSINQTGKRFLPRSDLLRVLSDLGYSEAELERFEIGFDHDSEYEGSTYVDVNMFVKGYKAFLNSMEPTASEKELISSQLNSEYVNQQRELAISRRRVRDNPTVAEGSRQKMNPIERVMSMQSSPILKLLSEEERQTLARICRPIQYQDGDVVIEQGAEGERCMYMVVTGVLTVMIGAAGDQKEVAKLGKGQIFGEMGMLLGEPRSATVKACGIADLILISYESFASILRKNLKLSSEIETLKAERVQQNLEKRKIDFPSESIFAVLSMRRSELLKLLNEDHLLRLSRGCPSFRYRCGEVLMSQVSLGEESELEWERCGTLNDTSPGRHEPALLLHPLERKRLRPHPRRRPSREGSRADGLVYQLLIVL
eukprot:755416-Hanusia_phi.AAC.4